MTNIWVDSRKRVAGTDSDFEFDVGETVHVQGSARLGVFKIRVADTFLSTDRGSVHRRAPGRLDQQQLRQRHLRGVAQRRQPSDPERPGRSSFVNEAGNQQVFTFVQTQPTFAAAAWPMRPTRWGRWATTSSPRSSASKAWATSWRRTPAA